MSNIHDSPLEHSGSHGGSLSVKAYLAAVVDAFRTDKNLSPFPFLRKHHFCAICHSVEITILTKVGNEFKVIFVVQALIRFWNDSVLHQRRKHRAGNFCRHPHTGIGSLLHLPWSGRLQNAG